MTKKLHFINIEESDITDHYNGLRVILNKAMEVLDINYIAGDTMFLTDGSLNKLRDFGIMPGIYGVRVVSVKDER